MDVNTGYNSLPGQPDYCSLPDYHPMQYPNDIAENTSLQQDLPFGVEPFALEAQEEIFSQACCEESLDFSDPLILSVKDNVYSTESTCMRMTATPIPHSNSVNSLSSLSSNNDKVVQPSSEPSPFYACDITITQVASSPLPPTPSNSDVDVDSDSATEASADAASVCDSVGNFPSSNHDNNTLATPDRDSAVNNAFSSHEHSMYSSPERICICEKKQKTRKKRSRCFIPKSVKSIILALFEEYFAADNTRTVSDIANQIFHDDLKHKYT